MDPAVLFLAEHFEGKLAPSTLELAAKARELAASSSGAPRGILLGHDAGALADSLTPYASQIVLLDDPPRPPPPPPPGRSRAPWPCRSSRTASTSALSARPWSRPDDF